MSIISIVAGGYSVRGDGWDTRSLPGTVMAVNDSALHLPHVDCVVSMDRLWTENRWDWLCGHKVESHIRVSALKNVLAKDMSWLHPFECDYTKFELSIDPRVNNGTNSAECAFNEAFKRMPSTILLFGFDMQLGPDGEKHWYPDHPWKSGHSTKAGKLREWSAHYRSVAKQCKDAGIQVWNMSSRSLIADFERGNSNAVAQ